MPETFVPEYVCNEEKYSDEGTPSVDWPKGWKIIGTDWFLESLKQNLISIHIRILCKIHIQYDKGLELEVDR